MKLAVIAHDGKKADMVAFLNRHYEFMHSANIEIIATGTTGKHAQDAGLKVETPSFRSTRGRCPDCSTSGRT